MSVSTNKIGSVQTAVKALVMTHSLISRVGIFIRIRKKSEVNFWEMSFGHLFKSKTGAEKNTLRNVKIYSNFVEHF